MDQARPQIQWHVSFGDRRGHRDTEQKATCRPQQRLDRGCHGPREPPGAGRGQEGLSPRALSRDTALPTPHFGLLAFGTVRERTSGVLSHQLCGDFYGSPEKLGRDGRFHRQLVQAARCRAPAVGFPSPSSSSPMSDPSLPFLPNIEGDTGVVWGNTPVA